IPLAGVRRADIETYLPPELGRYLKDPIVHAHALIRVAVLGEGVRPGFYAVPLDLVLADALMVAGGPTQDAKVDRLRILRGEASLWSGDRLQAAVARGATLEQLGLSGGDRIDVPGGPPGVEPGLVMQRVEPLLEELGPDAVLVYGASNAALAAALVAAKRGSEVGHVEAGLRNGDHRTSDGINGVVTDRLADPLFVPSRDAIDNLGAEGVADERVHFVGSVPIDTLCRFLPKALALDPAGGRGLAPGGYAVAALHQSPTVQAALAELGRRLPVVDLPPSEPLGYLETLG